MHEGKHSLDLQLHIYFWDIDNIQMMLGLPVVIVHLSLHAIICIITHF